ncbi:MAG: dihydrodipicolinate synthase family protein [Actinobacteria bacterium]|nr:dihydrodipicolinate synthase family protein [Actinomycetota bacterium]
MHVPEGVIAAMLTPFDDKGRIAEEEVVKLVNFLIEKGVDGIFPVSSCGEYVHLDMDERKYLIDIVVDAAKGRVDITPGTGATCHQKSIELANYAKEKGCSAVVLHGPFFFKNINEIVEGHLKKVALSVDIPIFLYNIPFFANEVTPEIAANLCSLPNIVGIKDSSGNMVNVMNLIDMTRRVKPEFKVLVGAEEILFPALAAGGNGCMVATACMMPEFIVGIYKNFRAGRPDVALKLQLAILELIRVMKSVNFPQGFKEAVNVRGIKMGPPKMHFNVKLMENLIQTRKKLESIMGELLSVYFPEESLLYNNSFKSYREPGFTYQFKELIHSNIKHIGCTNCKGCESDCENSSANGEAKQAGQDIEEIVHMITREILDNFKK